MDISEQVRELRKAAKWFEGTGLPEAIKLVNDADDTIESLSAKLQAANMERPAEDCKEERKNLLKEGDIVQHFKRETVEDKEHSMEYLYIIEAIATHTETNEKMVVYRALYKNEENSVHYNAFARPYDMFVAEVDHEKYPQIKQKYRFEKFDCGGKA